MNSKPFLDSLKDLGSAKKIPSLGHRIGGRWIPTQKAMQAISCVNPSTEEVICESLVDRSLISLAVDKAMECRESLLKVNISKKFSDLRKWRTSISDHSESFILAAAYEFGKPRFEMEQDLLQCLNYLDWIAEHEDTLMDDLLRPAKLSPVKGKYELLPLGIVAAYLPFSHALSSFVQYFSSAYLASAPLIVFSSAHSMLTANMIGIIEEQMDLCPGALSMIIGNFELFRQSLSDKRLSVFIYNGSKEHCETLGKEARGLGPRHMFLTSGGKNSMIVDESAHLDVAVDCALKGAFRTTGQLCSSTSRIFVASSRLKEFGERLTSEIGRIQAVVSPETSKSMDSGFGMGPLYSKKSMEKFLRFQTMAQRETRENYSWGKALSSAKKGFFVTPGLHLLKEFDPESAYQSNVLFCPDIAMYEFSKLEVALSQANATQAPYALSFCGDPEVFAKVSHFVSAPNKLVNLPTSDSASILPLTGRLECGDYRYNQAGFIALLSYPSVTIGG